MKTNRILQLSKVLLAPIAALALFVSLPVRAESDTDLAARATKINSWVGMSDQEREGKLEGSLVPMATQEMNLLGNGAKDWNPSNPKWAPVMQRVSGDIKEDIKTFAKEKGSEMQNLFARDIAAKLSNEDVVQLTDFNTTKQGKRFLALSEKVSLLMSGTIGRMMAGQKVPETHPTEQQAKDWKRLILATQGIQSIGRMMELQKESGGDTTGFAGIGIMLEATMVMNQEEFSRLYADYGPDLPTYEKFNESPAGKHMINALAAATMKSSVDTISYLSGLQSRIEVHRPEWQKMVQSN